MGEGDGFGKGENFFLEKGDEVFALTKVHENFATQCTLGGKNLV